MRITGLTRFVFKGLLAISVLRIRASNEDIGFDPAYQIVKTLVAVYEIRGRRQEVRIPEGDFLELP